MKDSGGVTIILCRTIDNFLNVSVREKKFQQVDCHVLIALSQTRIHRLSVRKYNAIASFNLFDG